MTPAPKVQSGPLVFKARPARWDLKAPWEKPERADSKVRLAPLGRKADQVWRAQRVRKDRRARRVPLGPKDRKV